MISTRVIRKNNIGFGSPLWKAILAVLLIAPAILGLVQIPQSAPAASPAQGFSMGVQAGRAATIAFKSQNGRTINGKAPSPPISPTWCSTATGN